MSEAVLEIVEPAVPEEMRVLADYRKVPASAVMWSGPTPSGGVTADLVELTSFGADAIERVDVKGKMVSWTPPGSRDRWAGDPRGTRPVSPVGRSTSC